MRWEKGVGRVFTGEELREVAFPLGGIGTGTISLGGRGNLRDWEIFNRPAKGRHLPYTFFALWARPEGGTPVARVLERALLPPFQAGQGLPTAQVCGLPRFHETVFTGGYPLARIDFRDDAVPLIVSLEALNPFIPMNDLDSGIPCALFFWNLRNPLDRPVEATLVLSLYNACGYDGRTHLSNRHNAMFGANLNELVREDGLTGIRMSSGKYAADHPHAGTMAAATAADSVTWKTRWERAGWWDDVQEFWDDLTEDGRLADGPEPEPSPEGQTDVGSLGATVTIPPRGEARIPFYITWRFPNLMNTWNHEESVRGKRLGNWYATQWPDAWSVSRYVHHHLDRLVGETRLFHAAFFDSTLPEEALDAASANASILRTTTCLRTEDGRLNSFEGCVDDIGCCPMNCTHVWNYEQAVAFLFPQLERTTRLTDFQHNTRPNGDMAFRTLLPLVDELWAFKPAADGQMGTIMKAYREWLQCGDRGFLEAVWPGVQRALEFAWSSGGWDPDRDGVMEGEQHNTYDIEFYGPNTMMGTFYLGALRAAEEMARVLGHTDIAGEYRALYESGRVRYDEQLWNGDYYVQRVAPPHTASPESEVAPGLPGSLQKGASEPRYQYGPGCLSDHLLGQWFARVVGLGDLLPEGRMRSALAAIFRCNFRRDLSGHASVQRTYALNDEAGLLLCTWPNGGRPAYPFPYADEVWTGIEYQVAAHLFYEGMLDEGMEIVRAVRERHDGAKRNPWNEFECGNHYARAMSSWSLLLALSGFHYDAGTGYLALQPRAADGDFGCFFSAGSAWGRFRQRRSEARFDAEIAVEWGQVTLRAVGLALIGTRDVIAVLDGREIPCIVERRRVVFAEPVKMDSGSRLSIRQGEPS